MLLLATLAGQGIVPPELAIVLVLGVNLGSSVIAPLLTRGMAPPARVVPVGNLLMRGVGSLTLLVAFLAFEPPLGLLGAAIRRGGSSMRHLLFNLIVLVFGLPLSRLVYAASQRIVALTAPSAGPAPPATVEVSALDEAAIDTPSQALANATREVVRTCEIVEVMLKRIIVLYEEADEERIRALAALDDRLDAKHAAIKIYLAKLTTGPLTEVERLRCEELLSACVKLEQVGDIVVRNMLMHVRKKMRHGLAFTAGRLEELVRIHAAVMATARLSFNVLVSRDLETARQIIEEKDRLRDLEKAIEPPALRPAERGDGAEPRDQHHPPRHHPRPQADELAARRDRLPAARGARAAARLAVARRLSEGIPSAAAVFKRREDKGCAPFSPPACSPASPRRRPRNDGVGGLPATGGSGGGGDRRRCPATDRPGQRRDRLERRVRGLAHRHQPAGAVAGLRTEQPPTARGLDLERAAEPTDC